MSPCFQFFCLRMRGRMLVKLVTVSHFQIDMTQVTFSRSWVQRSGLHQHFPAEAYQSTLEDHLVLWDFFLLYIWQACSILLPDLYCTSDKADFLSTCYCWWLAEMSNNHTHHFHQQHSVWSESGWDVHGGVPLHPRYNCQRETDLTESSWNNTLPVPCERPDNSNEQLSIVARMCKGEQEEK